MSDDGWGKYGVRGCRMAHDRSDPGPKHRGNGGQPPEEPDPRDAALADRDATIAQLRREAADDEREIRELNQKVIDTEAAIAASAEREQMAVGLLREYAGGFGNQCLTPLSDRCGFVKPEDMCTRHRVRAFLAATPSTPADLPPEALAVLRDPTITLPGEEDAINLLLQRGGRINDAVTAVLRRGCAKCMAAEHPYWHPSERRCPTSADTPSTPAPTTPPEICTHPTFDVDGLCTACLDKVALAFPVAFAKRMAEIDAGTWPPARAPAPEGPRPVQDDPCCALAASEIPGFGTSRDKHRCAKLHRDKPLPVATPRRTSY